MEEKRIRGKVKVIYEQTGLVFIRGDDKKDYITRTIYAGSKLREGSPAYFYPDEPRYMFTDGKPEQLKRLFARDAKRFNDLTDEEKKQFK